MSMSMIENRKNAIEGTIEVDKTLECRIFDHIEQFLN
jgi:hypothetical protein